MDGVRWRKVLADEVTAAQREPWHEAVWAPRRWFQTRAVARPSERAPSVVRRLGDAEAAWSGPGVARVTSQHLVFEDGDRRDRSRLVTIHAVVQDGDLLWVRRRRAPDWIARFRDDAEAEYMQARISRARS